MRNNRRQDTWNGVLLVDKPRGLTSHDVVDEIRGIVKQRRVGHCGTLDPLADGLLIICLGQATKLSQFLTGLDKRYEAVIRLGQNSVTGDAEGITESEYSMKDLQFENAEIENVLGRFRGRIQQRVPAYSAVRVDGVRLYERTRRGEEVELPIRDVEINELQLLDYVSPLVRISVRCSHGTYIRTLAEDIGRALGCGAYLDGLRRLNIGDLSVDNSLSLQEIKQACETKTLETHVLTAAQVLPYPALIIAAEERNAVLTGKNVMGAAIVRANRPFSTGSFVSLSDEEGNVLAVGHAETDSADLKSAHGKRVFTYTRVLQ